MITTRIEKMIGQEYLFVEESEQDFIRIHHVKITKNEFSADAAHAADVGAGERRNRLLASSARQKTVIFRHSSSIPFKSLEYLAKIQFLAVYVA